MANTSDIRAKFLVEHVFRITGRGIVFAGKILEGKIHVGDSIEFLAGDTTRRRIVVSASPIRKQPIDDTVGLILKCISEEEIDEIRAFQATGVVCEVYAG